MLRFRPASSGLPTVSAIRGLSARDTAWFISSRPASRRRSRLPQFPFVQTVGQQSQDNINSAFLLSAGPTVQVTAPNPNSGLGQGVFGVERDVGSGYSQQWNFTVQKTIGRT